MHDRVLETAAARDVRAGLVASLVSVLWTAAASAVAIVVGVQAGSIVLVAFGAVGGFDMAGSIALTAHFRHALRHQEVSQRREQIAHLIVSFGLLTVGVATLIASGVRLSGSTHTGQPVAGLVTSAASIVALAYLGTRKRILGRRIPSKALVTDGSLSLTGSGTAACALAGIGFNEAFGWSWVDPIAAMFIGAVAIATALLSLQRA